MRVGLFIPCYMDAFEPEVGIATLELLERLGCTVEYPVDQTCCGQTHDQYGVPLGCCRYRGAVRQELRRLRLHRRTFRQLRASGTREHDRDRTDAGGPERGP